MACGPQRIQEEVGGANPAVKNLRKLRREALRASRLRLCPLALAALVVLQVKLTDQEVCHITEERCVVLLHVLFKMACVIVEQQISADVWQPHDCLDDAQLVRHILAVGMLSGPQQ